MKEKEVAALLVCSREQVKAAILDGVRLPRSGQPKRLEATEVGGEYDISDEQLDRFIEAFEAEEPGRYPPVPVRRELLVEAKHKCGICGEHLPLQFHHILPWEKVKHHDPHHMIALCGGCHDKIKTGQIDRKSQIQYKMLLQDLADSLPDPDASQLFPFGVKTPLSWEDLHDVIEILHEAVVQPLSESEGKYDFSLTELAEKNRLNRLGPNYSAAMLDACEPNFDRIQAFLGSPRNTKTTDLFYEVADELRLKIAASQAAYPQFETLLEDLYHTIRERFGERLRGKRRSLRSLLSFMYVNCDIGRKA